MSSSSPPHHNAGKPPLLPHHIRTRQTSTDSAVSSIAPNHSNHHNNSSNVQERAELGLLSNLEHRRQRTRTSSGDVWHAAVEGERPPLATVSHAATHALEAASTTGDDTAVTAPNNNNDNNENTNNGSRNNLRDLARRVMEMNRNGGGNNHHPPASGGGGGSVSSGGDSSVSSPGGGGGGGSRLSRHHHKRGMSRAHHLLDMIRESDGEEAVTDTEQQQNNTNDNTNTSQTTTTTDNETNKTNNSNSKEGLFQTVGGGAHPEQGDSLFSIEGTNTDRLFAGASVMDDLFQTIEEEEENLSEEILDEPTTIHLSDNGNDDDNNNDDTNQETLPLRSSPDLNSYGSSNNNNNNNNNHNSANGRRLQRKKKQPKWLKFRQRLWEWLHPGRLLVLLGSTLEQAYFLLISVPIFFISWILYQYCDNPTFNFLPGNASLAWWFNLLGRLCLTLESARLVQWIVMDNIVLGTRTAARLLGPLVTLYAIQGRGWPFVVTTWSIIKYVFFLGDFASLPFRLASVISSTRWTTSHLIVFCCCCFLIPQLVCTSRHTQIRNQLAIIYYLWLWQPRK